MRFNLPRQFCISLWNVAGSLHSPKGMQSHLKNPKTANGKDGILFRCLLHFNLPKPQTLGPGKKNGQLLPDSLMPPEFSARGRSPSSYGCWDCAEVNTEAVILHPSFWPAQPHYTTHSDCVVWCTCIQHLLQVVTNLFHQRWGNLPELFLERGIICYFNYMFGRVGAAQFCRFQRKDIVVLSQELHRVESTNSWGATILTHSSLVLQIA